MLTIACQPGPSSLSCAVCFRADGVDLAYETTLEAPLGPRDAEEVRWLLEDRPRFDSKLARSIAQRIETAIRQASDQLSQGVFGGDGGRAVVQAIRGRSAPVEVRIEEAAGLPWIPWELLALSADDTPLSCSAASFVRRRAGLAPPAKPPPGPADPRPAALRILLVVSRPPAEGQVGFRSVAGRILAACAGQPGIALRILRPPTFTALKAALAEAAVAGAPFDIVHFDGHGVVRESAFSPGEWRGYLQFETEGDTAASVNGQQLGRALVESGVRVLVLNACRSAFGAAPGPLASPYESLAGEALAAGVSAVLAMGFNVYVGVAARLALDVYAALSAGRSLGEAVGWARASLRAEAGAFEWMTPVAFEQAAFRFLPTAPIPGLSFSPFAATAATELYIDPGAAASARSDQRVLIAQDEALLDLERAFQRGGVVEIVGLAGAGKSALAAEFARWIVATDRASPAPAEAADDSGAEAIIAAAARRLGGRRAALVIDLSAAATLEAAIAAAFDRLLVLASAAPGAEGVGPSDRLRVLALASRALPLLWVLDQADAHPAAESLPGALAVGLSRVVVTRRAPGGAAGVQTLVLPGLDEAGLRDLASARGLDEIADPDALAALLDWTRGLPALALAVLEAFDFTPPDALGRARRMLEGVRWGDSEEAVDIARRCGISRLPPMSQRPQDERIFWPGEVALYLFQGALSSNQWKLYAADIAFKSDGAFGGEALAWPALKQHLAPALRNGLVCAVGEPWLLLHPLAPYAICPNFYGLCQGMAGPDDARGDRRRRVLGILIGAFCGLWLAPDVLPPPARRSKVWAIRQNLIRAAALIIGHGWWHLIRVLPDTRGALLTAQRSAEWAAVFADAQAALRAHPPAAHPLSSADDPVRLMMEMRADLLAARGRDVEAGDLRRSADGRLAADSDETLESADGKVWNTGAIRTITALRKEAMRRRLANSPDALDPLETARTIAERERDELRLASIQLDMALAFGNVTSLRDLEQYEAHARLAIQHAEPFGKLGADIVMRAKNSLGNALMLQFQESPKAATPDRIREARAALNVAKANAADPVTRSTAANALGGLLDFQEDHDQAANEYLFAAKIREEADDWRAAASIYRNAARSLALAGRPVDAAAAATTGLEALARDENPDEATASALRLILRAVAP